MLILKIVALGPCMATVSPSVSAKSHKTFFRCSKARSTPLAPPGKTRMAAAEWGESEKVGRPSFTSYREGRKQLAAKNDWNGWRSSGQTFCKP